MMKRRRDLLDAMPPAVRARFFRAALIDVLGPRNGEAALRQMEPVLSSTLRQPGDAAVPEQNHWQGAWRIYELP